MNITIGNPRNPSIRHNATRVAAIAAAAALALTGVAGLSGADRADRATISETSRPITRQSVMPQPALQVVLVADAEQQRHLQDLIAADEAAVVALTQEITGGPMILVKGSSLEQAITSASGDVAATGRSVIVTDTTLPVNPGTPSAAVQPLFSSALDAEYAARSLYVDMLESMISGQATYGLPGATLGNQERVQPMFGTAADAEHAAQSLR